MKVDIDTVKSFWNANPCQSDLSELQDRKKYFEEITYKRYHGREWHVPIVAKFEDFKDKDVLEIGCSIATDGLQFAKQGARYVGIDLTPNGIELAKERFELFSEKGTFKVVNAEEALPFPNNSFDHIYSFGVIMASPHPEAIVEQMYRVLRPGGTFTVMLYNRSSINYYIEIMFLRKLFRPILYPKIMPRLLAKVTGFPEWKLNEHRKILIERGKLTKEEWLSINTDGPNCPFMKVYSKKEAAELFRRFSDVRQEVWEFNSEHWSFIGRLIPTKIERAIGRIWGWHRMIYGIKPA
jgi:ubiquinone/menaquinone biosynthesis C-methylase UbiE